VQRFATFAAKQWRHIVLQGRHFLALAQGVTLEAAPPDRSAHSCLFEWDGERFDHFQDVPSAWGYNWHAFESGGQQWLAYADHAEASLLLRWDGRRYEPVQRLEGGSGRAFEFFRHGGQDWLAFASLLGESVLYGRHGDAFVAHQRLSGPGAREWAWLEAASGDPQSGVLLQLNFIRGSRDAPEPMQSSSIHAWRGDRLEGAGEFASSGATDACVFAVDGKRYVAVANALSPEVRYRTDSLVWRIVEPGARS
jgi:hypothetical protein